MKFKKIKKIVLVYSKKAIFVNKNVFFAVKKILDNNLISYSSTIVDDFGYDNLNDVDLVIVLGGDGTFIRVSHYLQDEMILGINSDSKTSEGGLMLLNEGSLKKITEILNDKYLIKNRKRIDIYLNGKLVKEKALNEIYFGAKNQFHTSRYKLILDNTSEEQRSSGVLVVTCTGNTAWYKSAGGKLFSERDKLHYLVREPFRSRLFVSKLVSGKISEKIEFISKMYHEAVVALDSNLVYPVNYGEKVIIKFSDKSLNCISFSKE